MCGGARYLAPSRGAQSDATTGNGWKGTLMEILRRFWLLWTALGAIALGFTLLYFRSLSLGPILLVSGYCVLLPFFLWRSFRKNVGE
jgi:hypothetical protein